MRRAALALLLVLPSACKRSPRPSADAGSPAHAADAAPAAAAARADASLATAACGSDAFCLTSSRAVGAIAVLPDIDLAATDIQGMESRAIAAPSSRSIWRVGDRGVFAHETDKQTQWGILGGGKETLVGVTVDPTGQAWIASPHAVFRGNDGNAFQPVALPRDASRELESIWAAAPDDVWAVGHADAGPFLHFDGKAWTVPPVAQGDTYHAVWGRAANDIWAVGESIQHFDGHNWVGSGAGMRSFVLRAVWARAADDAWAVGDGGLIMHFDGKHWSEHPSGTTANLWSVSGNQRGVWVAGADGLRVRQK